MLTDPLFYKLFLVVLVCRRLMLQLAPLTIAWALVGADDASEKSS